MSANTIVKHLNIFKRHFSCLIPRFKFVGCKHSSFSVPKKNFPLERCTSNRPFDSWSFAFCSFAVAHDTLQNNIDYLDLNDATTPHLASYANTPNVVHRKQVTWSYVHPSPILQFNRCVNLLLLPNITSLHQWGCK